MKILFFILGSIHNRIDAWGIDNYKKILDQDIVFFGPIEENNYAYKEKNIPIIRIYHEIRINELFKKLPGNWMPDIVLCETPTINLIPDIYNCPTKTYLFIRDSWADAIFNKGIVELFDFFNYSVIDRNSYNKYNSKMLPLANTPVSLPKNDFSEINFNNRKIDILAIANYNDGFYHERYKTFIKISKELPKNFSIKFLTGLKKENIHNTYRRAKIVLDWAHTLSNRSFESALNGCLFFSHENNSLIREYWNAWEEYVPYNENNITELLIKYMNRPNECLRIINNASIKIKQKNGSFGEFLNEHLKLALNSDINFNNRIEYNNSIDKSVLWHRLSTIFFFNYHYSHFGIPKNWEELYFERIEISISYAEKIEFKKKLLIEAMRMAFLLKKQHFFENYKNKLLYFYPEYPWLYYLNARLLYENNDYSNAISEIKIALKNHKTHPDEINKFSLPFYERNNSADARRITNIMWQTAVQSKLYFEEKYFLHECYALLGKIYLNTNNKLAAIENFLVAVEKIPTPTTMHQLLYLLNERKGYETINSIVKKSYVEYPYDFKSIFYRCIANLKLKRKGISIKLLMQSQTSLRAFEDKSKYLNKVRIKKAIISGGIFIGWLPSFLIAEYLNLSIKILDKINVD